MRRRRVATATRCTWPRLAGASDLWTPNETHRVRHLARAQKRCGLAPDLRETGIAVPRLPLPLDRGDHVGSLKSPPVGMSRIAPARSGHELRRAATSERVCAFQIDEWPACGHGRTPRAPGAGSPTRRGESVPGKQARSGSVEATSRGSSQASSSRSGFQYRPAGLLQTEKKQTSVCSRRVRATTDPGRTFRDSERHVDRDA